MRTSADGPLNIIDAVHGSGSRQCHRSSRPTPVIIGSERKCLAALSLCPSHRKFTADIT